MSQTITLTKPQKAAAILVAIGKPAAGRLLKFFKQEELKALIEGARMLRTIPQSELERIVAEFEEEFAEGAGLLDSADTMDTILSENLTPEEVSAIMNPRQPGAPDPTVPLWPTLEKMEPKKLADFLAPEHAQTSAFMLSNLPPPVAASVLMLVEKPLRADIIRRMATMGTVTPQAKLFLEDRLRMRLLEARSAKSSGEGSIKVVSLLNELDKTQLDEVMEDLQAMGGMNVEEIRSKLFSFEDILSLSQKSRVALFDGLSSDVVTLALRNAGAELTEAVLSALGARSRRMIEAELSGDASVPPAEIAKARKSIAAAALRLAKEGAIELPNAQAA